MAPIGVGSFRFAWRFLPCSGVSRGAPLSPVGLLLPSAAVWLPRRALPLRSVLGVPGVLAVLACLFGGQFPQGGPLGFLGGGNEGLGPLPGAGSVGQIKEVVTVSTSQAQDVGPSVNVIHRNRPFSLFHLGKVRLWRADPGREVAEALFLGAQYRV